MTNDKNRNKEDGKGEDVIQENGAETYQLARDIRDRVISQDSLFPEINSLEEAVFIGAHDGGRDVTSILDEICSERELFKDSFIEQPGNAHLSRISHEHSQRILKFIDSFSRVNDPLEIENKIIKLFVLVPGLKRDQEIEMIFAEIRRGLIKNKKIKPSLIEALKEKIKNLFVFYEKPKKAKKISFSPEENASDKDIDLITPSVRKVLLRMGKLIKENRLREAKKLYEKMIRSKFHNYGKIWDEKRHNFMKEKTEPDPVVREVLDTIILDERFKEFFYSENTIIEFGPGVGHDLVHLARELPNIREVLAIEGYKKAADITRKKMEMVRREKIRNGENFGYSVINGDFNELMAEELENPIIYPPDKCCFCYCKSTIHYDPELIFSEVRLRSIHDIVLNRNGLFICALKTPESATFNDHVLVDESEDGYIYGIDKRELQARAFITQEKFEKMLNKAFFEVLKAKKVVIPKYDFDKDGYDEVFTLVFARALPRPDQVSDT